MEESGEDKDEDAGFIRAMKARGQGSNITRFFKLPPEPAELGRPQKKPPNAVRLRGISDREASRRK